MLSICLFELEAMLMNQVGKIATFQDNCLAKSQVLSAGNNDPQFVFEYSLQELLGGHFLPY